MSNESIVSEREIQEFWTEFPAILGGIDHKSASPEQIFEFMEKCVRDKLWYAQTDSEPLLSRFVDYRAYSGKNVLEIGFGTGWWLNEFIKAGANVYGIDLSKTHYELCQYRFKDEKVDLQLASAENIPYLDDFFDLVVSWGVIHHASNDVRCCSEIHRVLKPGERCFLMLYRKGGVKYYYQKLFKKGILRGGLLRDGFNVQEFIRSVTDVYSDDSPGAPLSRHYTREDIKRLFQDFSEIRLEIIGTRAELSDIPFGKFPVSDWILTDTARERLLRKHGGFWLVNVIK